MASKPRNFITPVGFLSYPNLEKPDSFGDTPQYRCNIVCTGEEGEAAVKSRVLPAIKEAQVDEFGGKVSLKKLVLPIAPLSERDQDTFDAEEGLVIKLKSKRQPIFFNYGGDVLDPTDDPRIFEKFFYPGVKVQARGWAYGWTYKGSKRGVSLLLEVVRFIEDAPPIGSSGGPITFDADEWGMPERSEPEEFEDDDGGMDYPSTGERELDDDEMPF